MQTASGDARLLLAVAGCWLAALFIAVALRGAARRLYQRRKRP